MKLTAVLANHAEAANNMLYIAGGGVDRAFIPPGAPAPYVVSVGIGVLIRVPWTQTNQEHTLAVDLVDADNQPVRLRAPNGAEQTTTLHADLKFNIGRPPTLLAGEEQSVALAFNMPGLPLPSIAEYAFALSIDGSEEERLQYRVLQMPGVPAQPGFGPGALSGF